jgi:ATP/maltotriose-dependent transcriptional regulator MalT
MERDGTSILDGVRAAVASQDWQRAYDTASAVTPSDDPALEAERLDLLADAAWWLGWLDDCTRAREAAYRLYEDLGERRRAGQCAVWLYEHHAFKGQTAIAGAWLRRGRRSLEGDEACVAYGALLLREAEVAHGRGALDEALAVVEQVIALGTGLRSFDLQAEALQAAGRVLIDNGHPDEGLRRLDEAMLFAVEGRLGPYSTGKVYCSMISACEDVGDYDRAAEWTEATQRWADDHPFSIFPGICRVHRASVLKRRGSLVEAAQEAARACEELQHSRPVATAVAWIEVGDIYRRLGEFERAEAAFANAQEIHGSPCSALALLRLAQGKTDTAKAIITGCMERTSGPLARTSLLPNYVQVAVAAGDLDRASAAVEELVNLLERFDSPSSRAALQAARGRVLLASGDPHRARVALQDALEQWQHLEIPYEAASTGTLLGQALRECGDDEGAAAAFRTAAALFDQIGARMVDDAPAPATTATRALPAGLTDREVEVLHLVAGGLTNQEIAASLFLSVKTISRHLSNIFTKIGVTSRTAATVYAFEHGLLERTPPSDTTTEDHPSC